MMSRTNPLDLSGRTVLVTGASSGIGREIAVLLSELGGRVVVSGRSQEGLEQTRGQLAAGAHAVEPFDLTDLEAVPGWVADLAARHGRFDGLVHAAGFRKTAGLRGLSVDILHRTFRVNLDSAVMLAKGFRQKGCCAPASSVVFVSSVAALVGTPAAAAYAASKAALIGLTKSLAIELAPERIRVNCVAPGLIESGMADQIRRELTDAQFAAVVAQHPLGLGAPLDVACAAAFLVSAASRWMTGQVLVLDGGYSA